MNHDNLRLVLASQSPRRRQLLDDAGFEYETIAPPDHVELPATRLASAKERVVESAVLKAQFVAKNIDEGIILSADTLASCGNDILGKPTSESDAKRMLQLMSGQRHHVLTGVCLWHRPSDTRHDYLEVTELLMDELSDEQLTTFLKSGEWKGKAGAFGYQDGLDWVHVTEGLGSNVVGLPVERLHDWIHKLLVEVSK